MPAASLRALLAHSVDYAGMFPPCSLALEPALQNQAEYARSSDAWMLNSFVLPLDKFAAATASFSRFDKKHPLRVSALGAKTGNATEWLSALKDAAEAIRSFSAQHVDLVSVTQLEMTLPEDVDLAQLGEARSMLGDLKLHVFWETPADAAEDTIRLLAQLKEPRFGYKLRTGGVTADSFPSSVQIGAALMAATQYHVPIKFTAGLHHPLRQFRDEVRTQMHGFLNVLGAAVLAAEHHWDEGEIVQMLEDERAGSFSFDETIFAWREWEMTAERIHARRKFVTSFGSCSFDEPREDLRALNLLPDVA
jgi:phage terminase large subunit-like protein